MLKSVTEALEEIRKFSQNYAYSSPEEILEAQPIYCAQWEDVVGTQVLIDTLVAKDGTKYLVMQTHTASNDYPPDSEGVLALYQAYRSGDLMEWLAGEYAVTGYQRSWDGVDYVAIQDAGANIYSPDAVPAIWEVMEE